MKIKVKGIDKNEFTLEVEGRDEHKQRVQGYSHLTDSLSNLLSQLGAVKPERIGGTITIEVTREWRA